jgi:imidazole glycerol-phosphate synthase subunit HisF
MSLVRIIARLDIKGSNLIKGIELDGHRVLGSVEDFSEKYYSKGIDEFYYQDSVASLYRRNSLHEVIKKTAEHSFIPLTVGGGIKSLGDIYDCLHAGADKISINSEACRNPQFINDAVQEFGSQCIVASIDMYNIGGTYEVWIDYGKERSDKLAKQWALELADRGAGDIIITSINRDGHGMGFENEFYQDVSDKLHIPLIASGGAGNPNHFVDVVQSGANAVAAASVFHYHYAKPERENKTMQMKSGDLRYGKNIDSGNINFINYGYGGQDKTNVTPCSISSVKKHMIDNGIKTRLIVPQQIKTTI